MSDRQRHATVCLLLGILAVGLAAPSWAASARDRMLKAQFVMRFATLVQWPDDAFGASEAAFVVGVIADEATATAFREVAREKRIHGRPVRIEVFDSPPTDGAVHALYVGSESGGIDTSLSRPSVLTISDRVGFSEHGGIIELQKHGTRFRFAISDASARRARLKISSRLLELAHEVHRGEP